MDDNSWLVLQNQAPEFCLPSALAARDAFHARDCGWVEQMRPFIRQFSSIGGLVLDPFCGFGTTLLAAHLEGRRGMGVELEAARAEIARERMTHAGANDQRVLTGDILEIAPSFPEAELILTNLPYFGCRWPGETATEQQLYSANTYGEFLEKIHLTFKALKPVLRQDGFIIVMVQNLRIEDKLIPFAWDTARLLSERYELLDERILIYDRQRNLMEPMSARSNRAHEYALIARNRPKPIDLGDTLRCLKELAGDYPEFVVYGSFAQWLCDPAVSRLPSDADLLVPCDPQHLTKLVRWFEQRGFRVTRWGAPLGSASASIAMEQAHYFRAERIRADGSLCLIDLCFEDARYSFASAWEEARLIDGLRVNTVE